MNPLLLRVLGSSDSAQSESTPPATPKADPVREDVPVPCAALPRTTFRDRLKKRRGEVARVVGEAQAPDSALIPDDAEEFEGGGQPYEKKQKPVKDVVMEPRDPYAEKEKLMTPSAALVAPDVTPEADQPIDPAAVPNSGNGARFRASDADREASVPNQPLHKRAMDTLLGRPAGPSQQAEPDAVVTAESAYAMMGIKSPDQLHLEESSGLVSGEAALRQGTPMPEHKSGDGRAVLSAFRRFVG